MGNAARGRNTAVGASFRAADQNTRVAASALSGGFAYRLFFWLLRCARSSAAGWASTRSPADAVETGGIPYAAADAVGDAARAAGMEPWLCLVVGIPALLWAGYTGAKAATLIHGLVWDSRANRRQNPLVASLVFSGLMVVIAFTVFAIEWLRDITSLIGLLAAVLTIGPVAALWLWVSLQLPHGDATMKALIPGAVFVGVGLECLYIATAYFLEPNLERSTAVYGAAGATSVLLFWMYLGGRLVVSPILNSSLYHEQREKHVAADSVEWQDTIIRP